MKQALLMLIMLMTSADCHAQEVFQDAAMQNEILFIGGSRHNCDSVKVMEDGKIVWRRLDDLNKVDRLTGQQFLSKVFNHNLCFEMEGDEPFWKAVLTHDSICFTDPGNGQVTRFKIKIHTNSTREDPAVYFMFGSSKNEVFGVINYRGFDERSCASYSYATMDEAGFYETFLCIRGKIYRGCAIVTERGKNL